MKKKIILTSATAIALCLCLIAGSTFAIFTGSTKVEVSVQSGFISISATLDNDLIVWSRLETEEDSDGKNFANGGTAEIVDGALHINRMTPGDNVKATISVANSSDVAVKYRVVMTAQNGDASKDLVNALVGTVSIADELGVYSDYPVQGSTTAWFDLGAQNEIKDLKLKLSLPDTVGNELMGTSAKLYITVEAVQWDGIAWDGTVDTAWYDADPTATTFEIKNAEELAGLAQIVNSGTDNFYGNTVTLTDDINLEGTLWTPIGYAPNGLPAAAKRFQGTFDGADHTISNMKVDANIGAGLFGAAFGQAAGATIQNVKIDKADITAVGKAGAIVGHLFGSIYNCSVTNTTINCVDETAENGDKVGAIVGWTSNETVVNITGCTAENVTIVANRDAGCIAGFGKSTMSLDGTTFTNVTVTWSNYGTGANITSDAAIGRAQ